LFSLSEIPKKSISFSNEFTRVKYLFVFLSKNSTLLLLLLWPFSQT
jgi:hypothetical protein